MGTHLPQSMTAAPNLPQSRAVHSLSTAGSSCSRLRAAQGWMPEKEMFSQPGLQPLHTHSALQRGFQGAKEEVS